MESNDKIIQILKQGRFKHLFSLLDKIETSSEDYGNVLFWKVKCLFEQGRIGQAAKLIDNQIDFVKEENLKHRLKLYRLFIGLFQSNSLKYHQEIEVICESLQKMAFSKSLHNFARDISYRAKAVQIGLGLLSKSGRNTIQSGMKECIKTYYTLGEVFEAKMATIRRCIFLLSGHKPNTKTAKPILHKLIKKCKTEEDHLTLGEAKLLLAELEFNQAFQKKQSPNLQLLAQGFDEAIRSFNEGGHVFGEAKVLYRWGNLLLKYGLFDGEKVILQAIEGFKKFDEISSQQSAWRTLNVWYTRHGLPQKAKEAFKAAEQLNAMAGISMSKNINWLAKADAKLRQGRIAESKEILLSAINSDKINFLSASSIAILATALGSVGLLDEAIKYLKGAIHNLKAHGPSIVLSQIWFILANQYSTTNPSEGIRCLGEAIKVDKQLGDRISEAQHLFTKGWFCVQQLRLSGQKIIITDEVKSNFNHAEALLRNDRRLEAMELLASLFQQRAHIEFLAGNYQPCADWYTKAEQAYRTLHLLPGLAFTLSHQGLILIEVARRVRKIDLYIKAKSLFKESQELFIKTGIGSMLWRVVFFQALCDYEAGKNIPMPPEKQRTYWKKADVKFENARFLVRQLREYSSYDQNALQKQTTGIAFGFDKQILYLTGFQFQYYFKRDNKKALEWLEQMKTRAMQDLLAENFAPQPTLGNKELVQKERQLRDLKNESVGIENALQIQQQIDTLLSKMQKDEILTNYAKLRKGEVISFSAIQDLLQ